MLPRRLTRDHIIFMSGVVPMALVMTAIRVSGVFAKSLGGLLMCFESD